MRQPVLYILFISMVFASACSSKFSQIMRNKDYEYKYKMAEQYYAKAEYGKAQLLFEDLAPYIKGTPRYEDLYYKLAYSYYHQKDYANAENLFKSFTETFPTSPKAEECDYMRAYSFYNQSPRVELDQTNTNKALSLLQAFINTHPASTRVEEANLLMEKCREKLELKELNSAQLYYNLGYYKAAAIAFASLSENFPDSKKSDEYKLLVIRSYFKYAEYSFEEKQIERYEKVLTECADFLERFMDSKLKDQVLNYKKQSNNIINTIKNEQTKKTI